MAQQPLHAAESPKPAAGYTSVERDGWSQWRSDVRSEVDYWRERAERFQSELEAERAWRWNWKQVRISSPLTPHHDIVTKSASSGWAWEWYEFSCPCCKRPLDITLLAEEEATSGMREAQPPQWPSHSRDWSNKQASNWVDYSARRRHAYCVALWGANAGYALGAAVLGWQLKEQSADLPDDERPDRVLLHTDDVPPNFLALLEGAGWTLKGIDYIDGVPTLYSAKGTVFDGVFTKLNAWGLEEYDKVLLLDIDLIPLRSLHSLFELNPPAAMIRGEVHDMEHGRKVDGRGWFGAEDNEWAWGQCGGINAGVILLRPCKWTFARMLKEVAAEQHPEHIRGAGPEQDYLSRFFAFERWSHIHVRWNFQIHHVFFSLEKQLGYYANGGADLWKLEGRGQKNGSNDHSLVDLATLQQDTLWRPTRLALRLDELALVHFSGDIKMWHMLLSVPEALCEEMGGDPRRAAVHQSCGGALQQADGDGPLSEEEEKLVASFTEGMIRHTCEGYTRWVKRTAPRIQYETFACHLNDAGRIVMDLRMHSSIGDPPGEVVARADVTPLVDEAVQQLREITRLAAREWRRCAARLLARLPRLLDELQHPQAYEGNLPIGTLVDVRWRPTSLEERIQWLGKAATEPDVIAAAEGRWMRARVAAVHADGRYVVKFSDGGGWGDMERHVEKDRVRPSQENHRNAA